MGFESVNQSYGVEQESDVQVEAKSRTVRVLREQYNTPAAAVKGLQNGDIGYKELILLFGDNPTLISGVYREAGRNEPLEMNIVQAAAVGARTGEFSYPQLIHLFQGDVSLLDEVYKEAGKNERPPLSIAEAATAVYEGDMSMEDVEKMNPDNGRFVAEVREEVEVFKRNDVERYKIAA